MKIKFILTLILMLIMCLCSCSNSEQNSTNVSKNKAENSQDETNIIEVRYRIDDNSYSIEKVPYGGTIKDPLKPQKNNYKFIGWSEELDSTELYDFEKPIIEKLTLFAIFELDKESIKNDISNNLKQSIVKITNKNYNTFLGFETKTKEKNGIGVIFKIQNGSCYILTNYHIIEKLEDYENQELYVSDYLDNEYEATIFQSANKTYIAASEEYDLAVLSIKPRGVTSQLTEIKFANISYSKDIITVAPTSVNALNISYYEYITLAPISNKTVKFSVIHCNGSLKKSGAPLLNTDLELIGISFAGISKNQNYTTYGIPINKICEFLNIYVYG